MEFKILRDKGTLCSFILCKTQQYSRNEIISTKNIGGRVIVPVSVVNFKM